MEAIIESITKSRRTIDGREYNVTKIVFSSPKGVTEVLDPVRTPEQQRKRDKRIRQAVAEYARGVIREKGLDWAIEHKLVTRISDLPPEKREELERHALEDAEI